MIILRPKTFYKIYYRQSLHFQLPRPPAYHYAYAAAHRRSLPSYNEILRANSFVRVSIEGEANTCFPSDTISGLLRLRLPLRPRRIFAVTVPDRRDSHRAPGLHARKSFIMRADFRHATSAPEYGLMRIGVASHGHAARQQCSLNLRSPLHTADDDRVTSSHFHRAYGESHARFRGEKSRRVT